jgi:hypothetical protein
MTATATRTARPASEKQVAFIERLRDEKALEVETLESLDLDMLEGLSTRTASSWIDYLMAQPRKASARANAVTEPGMYQDAAGNVFKVQRARTSGNLYAKSLVGSVEAGFGFEYAAGAIRNLTSDMRMTLEQASAFGRETGTCCNCGALLTDPKSVAAGIGPICASRI